MSALLCALGSAAACGSGKSNGGGGGTGTPSSAGPYGNRTQVTSSAHLDKLGAQVDVVRDQWGMVHIFGKTLTDTMRAQGYMEAHDRAGEIELFRRVGEGRLAELFGNLDASIVDQDIAYRVLGFTQTAQKFYAALPAGSQEKLVLDAFADGVDQYFAKLRNGTEKLPAALLAWKGDMFTPFTPVDVICIALLEGDDQGFTADQDVATTQLVDDIRSVFNTSSSDPAVVARAGFIQDMLRFAPADPTTPMKGFPDDPMSSALRIPAPGTPRALPRSLAKKPAKPKNPVISRKALDATNGFQAALMRVRKLMGVLGGRASNNWVVGPSKTASGHVLVSNDPHMTLNSPSIMWPVHVSAEDNGQGKPYDVAGVEVPGLPAVVIGFNKNVGWGLTNAYYDQSDAYQETIAQDGKGVMFKGQEVAFQTRKETVKIHGSPDYTFDVQVVPHHGPIMPDIVNHKVQPTAAGGNAISMRWATLEGGKFLNALLGLNQAESVDEARRALLDWDLAFFNMVIGDSSGNIYYSTQSLVPVRDKRAFTWDPTTFTGTLPNMVEPGDGTAEWTGYLDERYVPHEKNPAAGYIATANGDQIGATLDNDPSNATLPDGTPMILSADYAIGFRVGRIYKRLASAGNKMTLDTMANIQADVKSPLGSRLVPRLLTALQHAEEEKTTPGSHPDLTADVKSAGYAAADIPDIINTLTKWGADSDYDEESGMNPDDNSLATDAKEANAAKADLIFNDWFVRELNYVFGDEDQLLKKAPDRDHQIKAYLRIVTATPTDLATYDASTGQSALWDDMNTPNVVETPDERMLIAMITATADVQKALGSDRNGWRWGKLHTITLPPWLPLWQVAIPSANDPHFPKGFPRHGGLYTVDVANYPALRDLTQKLLFTYAFGPATRFVVELDPAGPKARQAIPGGASADPSSPHYADDMEHWRRNENHPIPFSKDDVATDSAEKDNGEHILLTP
jgi:penicillin amidase